MLTTEVFNLLDLLPRSYFLAGVLSAAHDANQHRSKVTRESEQVGLVVLPGDVSALRPDGSRSAWSVQPDVVLESEASVVWVEVKRIRASSFQEHQLARTLSALVTTAAGRTPLLLLILADPTPVPVRKVGRVSIAAAVEHSADHVSDILQADALREAVSVIAWITWDELRQAVAHAQQAYFNPDRPTTASVERMAEALLRAIAWHS